MPLVILGILIVAVAAFQYRRRERNSPRGRIMRRLAVERSYHKGHLAEGAGIFRKQAMQTMVASTTGQDDLFRRFEIWLSQTLRQAGSFDSPRQFLGMTAGVAGGAGFVVGVIMDSPIQMALVLGLGALAIRTLLVSIHAGKRAAKFDKQLALAIPLMLGGLRAGLNSLETLEQTAKGTEPPIQDELSWLLGRLKAGHEPGTAFDEMAAGVNSPGAELFAQAVALNWESGGRLAQVLEKLKELLEGRFTFEDKVNAASAEQQLTMKIIMIVPWVLGGIMYWRIPEDVALMWQTTPGLFLVGVAVVLQSIGYSVCRQILKPKTDS